MEFPYRDFGGTGQSLIFLHANGYPPECYVPLITRLASKHHVLGMLMRPLWDGSKPEELKDWQPLSDDLNQYIATCHNGIVIGAGHSLGAVVALRSALQAPKNFRALILIDPVLFSPIVIQGWRFAKYLGLGYKVHPLIPRTKERRRHFDDLDVLYNAYRHKRIFRYIDNQNLRIMINGMVKPSLDTGYDLAYSPEWEIQIYYTGVSADADIWQGLRSLEVPLLIIRGAETDTLYPSTAAKIKRIHPETQVVTVEKSTHLVPLEKPIEVSEIILEFLENVK